MYSLLEIFQFIAQQTDRSSLKEYYDKCYENLKDLQKRSNLISFFIIIIFALFCFSSYVNEFSIVEFKVSKAIVIITSPLLLSYFLLEWCLLARRRRELMKIIKHIGFELFHIPAIGADYEFRHFSLHSRNIMPFSFMIEFVNVDVRSTFRHNLFRVILLLIFLTVTLSIGTSVFESLKSLTAVKLNSLTEYKIFLSTILCNILSLVCAFQIILFYKNEIQTMKIVNAADRAYIASVQSPQPDN